MPNVLHYDYGPKWDYLLDRGWKIKPTNVPKGTANCDCKNKTIWMKPSAFSRPSLRIRKYVVPHEIWHALHCEILQYECDELRRVRSLTWASAVEAVADGGVLYDTPSSLMRTWVRASIAWHGRVGYKYKYSDIVSPEAMSVIFQLDSTVDLAFGSTPSTP